MRRNIIVLFLFQCAISYSNAQDLSLYTPTGFHNPLLKSGQFIATGYYYYHLTTTEYNQTELERGSQLFNMSGILGLTDNLTLNTSINVHPQQTISDQVAGGSGKIIQNFYINPNFLVSYRMNNSIEFFADYSFDEYVNKIGPSTYKAGDDQLTGIDPDTGELIYGGYIITPARPDYTYNTNRIRVGVTYVGSLW